MNLHKYGYFILKVGCTCDMVAGVSLRVTVLSLCTAHVMWPVFLQESQRSDS